MIIFDTETTGLNAGLDQIAQLSYIKMDENYKIEFSKNFYFTVDNIDAGASRVNGLTVNLLKKLSNNKRFGDCVDEIFKDFKEEKLLIAHNIQFDKVFLIEEFKRAGKDIHELNCEYFCTMQYYTDILRIPHTYYGYKFPQLKEVVEYLNIERDKLKQETAEIFDMNIEDVNYHDARFDIVATMNIYKYIDSDFQSYESMQHILSNVCDIESNIAYMKAILKENKLEDINIRDIDNIRNLFNEAKEDCRRFSSVLHTVDEIKNLSNSIYLYFEKEIKKIQEKEELKLKEDIEKILNNYDTTIIKAVLKEENNFNRLYETILFNLQVNDSYMFDCPFKNLDIIKIYENRYLVLNYDEENSYILNTDNEKFDYFIYETKFDAYPDVKFEKINFEICFPERFYNIESFKTTTIIPSNSLDCSFNNINKDNSIECNIEDDDEIPF